ncbi:hypothetical protein SAMN05660748_0144 [Blastococcus aggregatus]|uniref:DUF4367 domain-containing protein n=1 Tax=Blastococcus aggregatus TaxID=38502 RepID=A0A285UWJ4_9ACTN|nr:hypothetical protein [Blastococcus aggregatus]SOC46285.1 hypothetical protein SAMN05660748_0144 [Blastococcus aggregatus]
MRHPTDGVLRRLIDEPAGVAETDRRHVAGCPQCLAALAATREDAALVGAALSADAEVDVPAAWTRLSTAAAGSTSPARDRIPARRGRLGDLVRRPAAAALAVGVVLAGAGTAAANDWLPIFRTEEVAAVGLRSADLLALPDLAAYGDVELTGDGDLRSVPDAETAATESGLDVPEVDALPAGVTGGPVYQVGGQVTATFTFSAERAARAAAEAGEALPTPPPGLDGSSVRLVAGPGVAQVWTTTTGAPGLIVGRAVAPTAFSSGIPFETVRDYLLSLPGLPDDVAAQLRAFTADGSTLPLPVPSDYVTTSTEDVDGERATVLATRDRMLAAVVWVADGELTVVAGPLDTDEVLTVARGLR